MGKGGPDSGGDGGSGHGFAACSTFARPFTDRVALTMRLSYRAQVSQGGAEPLSPGCQELVLAAAPRDARAVFDSSMSLEAAATKVAQVGFGGGCVRVCVCVGVVEVVMGGGEAIEEAGRRAQIRKLTADVRREAGAPGRCSCRRSLPCPPADCAGRWAEQRKRPCWPWHRRHHANRMGGVCRCVRAGGGGAGHAGLCGPPLLRRARPWAPPLLHGRCEGGRRVAEAVLRVCAEAAYKQYPR